MPKYFNIGERQTKTAEHKIASLLPNKALSDYEIAEDKKIAGMSPEERETYLKAKEEKFKKYLESVQQSPKPKEVSLNSA